MIRWWRRRSVRTRITLVVGAVAVVVLLAVARLAAGLLFSAVLTSGDDALRERTTAAASAVAAGTAVPPTVRVIDTAGVAVDGRGPVGVGPDDVGVLAAGRPATVVVPGEGPRRWVATPALTLDGSPRLVLADRDLVGAGGLLVDAAPWLVGGALLAAVLVTLAARWAAGAALRGVDRMRTAAGALAPGERLPVPGDELGPLADAMNALLARRDEAVERLERFTGEAAHELRSPIASLRAQAEVAVAHPSAEPAERTWSTVAGEAERLSRMVDDLLTLARADAGERMPARSVDLVEAVEDALARWPTDPGVATTLWAPFPATVAATPAELAIVLDNVLANARRHARSVVHVSVVPAGRRVRLLVDDDGPGIPPQDRARVFDRFARVAPAADGGTGIGLALVARLVEGRGGTARAGASPDGGARLALAWPSDP